jgi:hypothetical protein
VRKISQATVKRSFSPLGVQNKDQMARFIAARFPELARYIPPERKSWMSEDQRMAIFDAAAFALVAMNRAGATGRGAEIPSTAPFDSTGAV